MCVGMRTEEMLVRKGWFCRSHECTCGSYIARWPLKPGMRTMNGTQDLHCKVESVAGRTLETLRQD
jgi:hypothetical protein